MHEMLAGAIATASFIVSLFFFRFWRTTHDRLFLFFALSFFLETFNRIAVTFMSGSEVDAPIYYVLRLIAYSLILVAIADKNRERRKAKK